MISILLPTYNGEKYLYQSIESIIKQTYSNFEIIIGLNGVTDNSRSIISEFNDSRIRVFDYEDKGKSKTLNKLLKESRFDWISIQDDDDIWVPNKLERQVSFINNYDVIGTFINYINEHGIIIGSPNLYTNDIEIKRLSLCGNNQIANTSAIFKKTDALEIGGWREDIDGIEDYDFWVRLMRKNKKFINIPEVLVLHRLHPNSKFNTKVHDLKKII